MLKVKSLNVSYGGVRALTNISLHVGAGEFVSLIGSNGAGKTTLLSAIMGLVPAQQGDVEFQKTAMRGLSTPAIVQRGMTLVPEGRRVFTNMTVEENIQVGSYPLKGKVAPDRLDFIYSLFPVLKERRTQAAGMLSGGEQQMLAIARALMSNPSMLLMDEPSMGLAPLVIKDVYEKLTLLKKTGLTIFLVEQNAKTALSYADRGYVLENGHIVLSGTGAELLNDNEVMRAYLGKEYKEKWER